MTETTLTPEMILESAEDVLRRFGPTKATVVDVARALGVSHGSVYRHFVSKAALRDAVTERWLARVSAPLAAIVTERGAAIPRLRRWFELLMSSKRSRAQEDPELFATYIQLAGDARGVVNAHVEVLVQQIAQIIADGVIRGELAAVDPAIAARALFDATVLFHNPVHAAEWSSTDIDASFDGVWYLALRGLQRDPQTRVRRGLPAQRKGAEAKSAEK
jgi:AcrR family transcriptional regulator